MRPTNRFSLTVLLVILAQVPLASAMDIIAGYRGGTAPANSSGAGNLVDIFNAAAHIWESAYRDQFTLRLYFGWAPLDSAGNHTLIEQGGDPNREITGIILFDNSGKTFFYLDPTPFANEEYLRATEEFEDLGGGRINVARIFRNPVGEAAGRVDLLSVALHEIGHALGLCAANPSFIQQSAYGSIGILGQLPFAGTTIPMSSNFSGVTPHFDPLRLAYGSLMAGVGSDERRIPSELEILANAQISGFRVLNLSLDWENTEPAARPVTRTSAGSAGGR
jgi:hypothetical protein